MWWSQYEHQFSIRISVSQLVISHVEAVTQIRQSKLTHYISIVRRKSIVIGKPRHRQYDSRHKCQRIKNSRYKERRIVNPHASM